MASQLRLIALIFAVVGAALISLAAWMIWHPACPAIAGLMLLTSARYAFIAARKESVDPVTAEIEREKARR